MNVIMSSKEFREELEQLVAEQMKTGPHPSSLLALQQISELILPQYKMRQSSAFNKCKQYFGICIIFPLPLGASHPYDPLPFPPRLPQPIVVLLTLNGATF